MRRTLFKACLLAAASAIPLQAYAHTSSVGYVNTGPGAVTFWYGTYHGGTNFSEGSFQLTGQNVTYNVTVPFTQVVQARPTGLVDGTNNFFSNGTTLVGTYNGTIAAWQGVSFANLLPGTYVFTYVPIQNPTQTWQPMDSVILSSSITLTAQQLGQPVAPVVVDLSQPAFSQNDAAATGNVITFAGGTLAATSLVSFSQPVTLTSAGGVVDTALGNVTFTGPITGEGGIIKNGAGVLTLSGTANSYTGGLIINEGAVIGDSGSLKGAIVNNANLTFNQLTGANLSGANLKGADLSAATFAGAISGSGGLTKSGPGTLVLSGANTYTGSTVLTAGTLQIANAGALGSGPLIAQGGTLNLGYAGPLIQNLVIQQPLTIDTNSNIVIASGALSGNGGLTKIGGGTLNLTGANLAGANFSGAIAVMEGKLSINTVLPNTVATINQGGQIGGAGRIGGLIVRTRATAAPGNSIGQLSVATFVIFEPASAYAVEVDATGASDAIAVTDTATLQGGVVQVQAAQGDYKPATTYRILTAAGGVSGKFEGATSNLAFLSPELTYSAGAVDLTLIRNDALFASVAQTRNQMAASGAADLAFPFGTGVYDSLVRSTAAEARGAFDQLSGEIHAAAFTTAIADGETVRRAVLGHAGQGGETGVSGWGEALGSWGKVKTDGNGGALDRTTGGLVMGLEAASDTGLRLGLAGGFTQTSVDQDARRASGEMQALHLMAYGAKDVGRFALRGGVGVAGLDAETTRTPVLRTTSGRLTADGEGRMAQAFVEAGYRTEIKGVKVEPMAGLAAYRVETDALREQGGAMALTVAGETHDLTVATLGVRAERTAGGMTVRAGVAWNHALKDMDPTVRAAFQAGGPAFEVAAVPVDQDSLALDLGVDWKAGERFVASAGYQGRMGERAQDHALKASVSWRF